MSTRDYWGPSAWRLLLEGIQPTTMNSISSRLASYQTVMHTTPYVVMMKVKMAQARPGCTVDERLYALPRKFVGLAFCLDDRFRFKIRSVI